ncbi:ParB/RepB/Spo0J family partition protein [Gemmatimonas sp.]|uniref:ParB/RepB/Spo0J family partition protein n=1 Tax=Gemmatimonas sp. TaxID=1962908 RepID=UPI00286E775B|nr:ParB/RepB/Spo0J family partition protein [Gemmatimonas sp.]
MTPEPPRRLGRGLDALLARRDAPKDAAKTAATGADANAVSNVNAAVAPNLEREESPLRTLKLSQIRANPYQPRQEFRPEELADLEASLRVNGLLQPITVRPAPNGTGYELIAGERRFRAASRLGWTEIPALVKPVDDKTLLVLAMIENLQRADLDPIEEADGYQRLADEFQLSNQEVADVVGKDRSTVANALRLRQLPASVRRMLQEKQLTAGHARAILPLAAERAIVDMARDIIDGGLSVREVERRVQAGRPKPPAAGKKPSEAETTVPAGASAATVRQIEERLRRKLQTGVSIQLSAKDKGEVRIAFFSNDDLERLLELLGVSLD